MFKDYSIRSYLKYSLLAAFAYGLFLAFFIKDNSYLQIYLLFIGNLTFGICIAIFIWQLHNKFNQTKSVGYLVKSGMISTVIGILISVAISFLLLLIITPELFNPSVTNDKIAHAPVGLRGNYSILSVILFSVVGGNVVAGGFISVLFSSTIKRFTKQ